MSSMSRTLLGESNRSSVPASDARGVYHPAPVLDEPYGVDVLAPAYELPDGRTNFRYSMSREEMLKGLANRFVHSTTYLYLYATMAVLSLVTVIFSLLWTCPGPAFYILELLVNVILVAEVCVRFVAYGRNFWKSTYNIIDLFLVVLCILTLIILFVGHGCSPIAERPGMSEELLDSVLLIVRNVMQCMRLISVIRRSGYNVASRITAIDLSDAHDYNLDLDLEHESSQALQRMRDGGDQHSSGNGWSPQTRPETLVSNHPNESVIAMDSAELDDTHL
ncbi:ion transport protein [Malassezia restricta]|uniref:ion transport protein n=1 Tax=Malassezia restricta TaxID=76775 RepID=UPI000DD14F8A|nr:ion transport protein [Malassezia restricta]AXA48990.1 ion transport protein [Malassezia restricta]